MIKLEKKFVLNAAKYFGLIQIKNASLKLLESIASNGRIMLRMNPVYKQMKDLL